MSIFIKAGLWVEKRFGNKGEFNLTQYIQQFSGTGVTSVTATIPLSSSGSLTPNITIQQANTNQSGYLSSIDWNTFNDKQNVLFFNSINSGVEIETTSTTDVVVTGMTITPPAGTYKVDFNGEYDVIAGNIVALAQVDLSTLVLYLTNLTPTAIHPLTFGSGEIITPGIYSVNGAASVAGILTLDGGGDPNALFVFKIVFI